MRAKTAKIPASDSASTSKATREGALSLRGLADRGIPGVELLRLDPMVVGVSLLLNLLGLALPLATLQAYDRIIPNHSVATLTALALGLTAVAFCEFLLRLIQGALLSMAGLRHAHFLQSRALHAICADEAPDGRNVTAQLDRYNAIERLGDYFGGQSRVSVIDLPFSVIFLAAIAAIGGWLVLAPIGVFLAFLMVTRTHSHRAHVIATEREAQDGRAADFFAEAFSRAHTVKSLAIEALMLRRFERLLKRSAEIQQVSVATANDMDRTPVIFANLSSISTLTLGALLVMQDALTVGGLAACSLLAGRAIQPLLRAARSESETQKASVAADQVAKLFADAPSAPAAPAQAKDAAPAVRARNLAIHAADRVLIADARFDIEPGEFALLLGPDGSGRSSLLHMIAGLREPDGGRLRVGELKPSDHRRAVGARLCYAGASDVLFSGTILQNLTLFGRGARLEDARWAAELTGLERRIHMLPEGYDTKVGQGVAETLSAGFIQGVILTRAIARRPRLLLLDEPFAYLDADFVKQVLTALRALRGETTIIAAPSQSGVAAAADQLLVFSEGRIVSRSPISAPRSAPPPAPAPASEAETLSQERPATPPAQTDPAAEGAP